MSQLQPWDTFFLNPNRKSKTWQVWPITQHAPVQKQLCPTCALAPSTANKNSCCQMFRYKKNMVWFDVYFKYISSIENDDVLSKYCKLSLTGNCCAILSRAEAPTEASQEHFLAAFLRSFKAAVDRHHSASLVGGWPTPLKNMSQLGLLFQIYGKIKNVPNH